jgi:RNA polymerase sigma-70 factor (ECF subfamily)
MIDDSRKNKRKREFEQQSNSQQVDQDNFYIKQEYRQVIEAMKMLENDEREILSLVLTENLKYREIAPIMGITENNVKVKVHRARLRLREIIEHGDLS